MSLLGHRISFKFLITSSLTIVVIFLMLFLFISRQQENHIMEQVKKQAKILHRQVILTRQWVAGHGYILIKKTPGIRSNPYLEEPDVKGEDGATYTKITPAILTARLSEAASNDGGYSFRLTNKAPLNPTSVPDKVESEALRLFDSSQSQGVFRTEVRDGKKILRYLAPVHITENCLQCHMAQGHKPGDVGGCLSVFIPMGDARSAINESRLTLLGVGAIFAGSLIALLFVATRALVFKRIGDIREALSRMNVDKSGDGRLPDGDEIKEIADLCYFLDKRLQDQHKDLERKIGDATRDLYETNESLETANRELTKLNEAKSEFFSDISHELRTPLTSIKGAADILARKASRGDPIYIDIIKRNADHLIKSVVDFLDYSKIEAGQLELVLERSSIVSVAEDAILSQKALAAGRSINIALEAANDPYLNFDRQRIFQVITNLLSNAVKFSPDRGDVALTIQSEDGEVTVCVQDDGPGIDEGFHEAIFRKFYQVPDPKATAIHKGSSGIGLAICNGIVEAHGGRIWVESEPGRGSRFFFSLPAG